MHEIERSTLRDSGTQPIRGNEVEAGKVTGLHRLGLHPIYISLVCTYSLTNSLVHSDRKMQILILGSLH